MLHAITNPNKNSRSQYTYSDYGMMYKVSARAQVAKPAGDGVEQASARLIAIVPAFRSRPDVGTFLGDKGLHGCFSRRWECGRQQLAKSAEEPCTGRLLHLHSNHRGWG